MEALRFNTAIAKLIELNNHLTKMSEPLTRDVAEPLVLMLAPFAPHVGEELWRRLGHEGTITYVPFPDADPALLVDDTVEYPVQVNGKVRSRITVAADADADDIEATAMADPKVVGAIGGCHAEEGHRRPRPHGQHRHLTRVLPAVRVPAARMPRRRHSAGPGRVQRVVELFRRK